MDVSLGTEKVTVPTLPEGMKGSVSGGRFGEGERWLSETVKHRKRGMDNQYLPGWLDMLYLLWSTSIWSSVVVLTV